MKRRLTKNQQAKQEAVRTEVCRSYSFKINVGRYDPARQYESQDVFCSQKAECTIADAAEVSAALFAFCKAQVLAGAKEIVADIRANAEARRKGAA